MKKILIVVHQLSSEPGLVGQLLTNFGYALDIRRPCLSQELPATMDEHEAVVIFGGPMSANDSETLPFIRTELDWIPIALASSKPFLGICLGAQLLARTLGAKVAPHPEGVMEIGYFPLIPVQRGQGHFDIPQCVYHWHREGFELPAGSQLLARGELFPNQAFGYGEKAIALQFHPEITSELIDKWTTKGADLLELPRAQSRCQQFQGYSLYGRECQTWLQGFLRLWLQGNLLKPNFTPVSI